VYQVDDAELFVLGTGIKEAAGLVDLHRCDLVFVHLLLIVLEALEPLQIALRKFFLILLFPLILIFTLLLL